MTYTGKALVPARFGPKSCFSFFLSFFHHLLHIELIFSSSLSYIRYILPAMHPANLPPTGLSQMSMVSSPNLAPRSIYDSSPYRSATDFEIEYSPGKTPRPPMRRMASDYTSPENMLQSSVARIVAAKARPFCVSGRIPVDPANLTMFFRTKVRPTCHEIVSFTHLLER
jgi:hypothetical protein